MLQAALFCLPPRRRRASSHARRGRAAPLAEFDAVREANGRGRTRPGAVFSVARSLCDPFTTCETLTCKSARPTSRIRHTRPSPGSREQALGIRCRPPPTGSILHNQQAYSGIHIRFSRSSFRSSEAAGGARVMITGRKDIERRACCVRSRVGPMGCSWQSSASRRTRFAYPSYRGRPSQLAILLRWMALEPPMIGSSSTSRTWRSMSKSRT